MVGIVFCVGGTGCCHAAKEISDEIEGYSTHKLYESDNINVYNVCYPTYPTKIFDFEDFTIILEGEIYDPQDYEKSLRKLFMNGVPDEKLFKSWAKQIDGDFNLYVIDESNEKLRIFTDILNRLPIYYTKSNNIAIGGRSLRFVKKLYQERSDAINLDQMAIAEFLLLGYYVGKRTPYKNIHKSVPASKITLSVFNSEHTVYNQLSFDVENKNHLSLKENAENLVSILSKAILDRSSLAGSHAVSLSGGKDSRLIASLLKYLGIEFSGYSFYNKSISAKKDTAVALKIAQSLNINWTQYFVQNSGGSLNSLYKTKGGMNYLALGFLVNFLQKIVSENDSYVNLYTGDIGDLLDGSWSFENKFTNNRNAAQWLISKYKFNDPHIVEEITGITREELISEIVSHLNNFPEGSVEDRLQHFLIQERGFNMDFQGEDRNRSYIWTLAPLNSWPVVNYLMTVPKNQKFRYKLTKEVFKIINNDMIFIDYSPYDAPMGSYIQLFREWDFGITSRLEKLKYNLNMGSDILDRDNQKIENYIYHLESLDYDHNVPLDKVSECIYRYGSEKYTILTLLAIIEDLEQESVFFNENSEVIF